MISRLRLLEGSGRNCSEISEVLRLSPRFIQEQAQPDTELAAAALPAPGLLSEDPIRSCYRQVQLQYLKEGFPWIPRMQAQGGSIPLRGIDTAGLCGHVSDLAKAVLCMRYRIPEDALHSQCMGLLQEGLGKQEDDRHAFLYLPHAERYVGGDEPYDEFIDFTSSQFSGQACVTGDHSFEGLYRNLSYHGGLEGKALLKDLFRRGAVSIPHTPKGTELLQLLVSSYAPYEQEEPPPRLPIEREDLYTPNSIHHYQGLTAEHWLRRQLPYLRYFE